MDWKSQVEMFMPHGMCLLWRPELMSLHIISDALIALAYFTIPFAILRFVRGRTDLDRGHMWLAFLFAAFIALCGLTHVLSIIVLWMPIYIVEGWLKAATAIVSVVTAVRLTSLVPLALKLPSIGEMQREVSEHRKTAAFLSAVPGLIYAKDRSGRLTRANKATLDLLGRPWQDVEGKQDIEILDDRHQAEIVMANDRLVMETGTPKQLEEIIDHPDKGPRILFSTKAPLAGVDESINGIVGLSVDITERKVVDERLLHAARRTAMGDMAASIAHEINQPLAAIAMYIAGSKALLDKNSDHGPISDSLMMAKGQCLRAGEIIRRVRHFVSGGGDEKQAESIAFLVDEACALALLHPRDSIIKTTIEHTDGNTTVFAHRVQIEQVVVNLVRNAIDAMADATGSTLDITTSPHEDGMTLVSVIDNGPGISADIAGRLFQPFVSTKGVKGMGVGLSLCRTIIESHGGKIWVEPNVGKGATFRFALPALNRELAV